MSSLDKFTNPQRSLSVMASAGTGKTYLLIKRLARIMLYEQRPDSILALTFSNRATAELRSRLHEECQSINNCNDDELDDWLTELGEKPNEQLRATARSLYHRMLTRPPVIINTFHGFCQDLITRFALHNGRDSSFQIITNPKPYMLRSRIDMLADDNQELLKQAGLSMAELERFLDNLGSDYSLARVLEEIQTHIESLHLFLRRYLSTNPEDDKEDKQYKFWRRAIRIGSFNDDYSLPAGKLGPTLQAIVDQQIEKPDIDTIAVCSEAGIFSKMLLQNGTQTGIDAATRFLAENKPINTLEQLYQKFAESFLTQTGTWRKRLYSKSILKLTTDCQKKLIPESKYASVDELENWLIEIVEKIDRYLTQQMAVELNVVWLKLGWCYLRTYQQVKQRNRLIDFDDMQMQAWQLLHRFEDHSAIQHKLSGQIRHILVDEFQDTSLLQWEIIEPFVNEIVCQQHDHPSSVFIIGDSKQSIYRFRGAELSLLNKICHSLREQYGVEIMTIDKSYRTSTNILKWINPIFTSLAMDDFHSHESALDNQWGAVRCLPFVDKDQTSEQTAFKDPGREVDFANPFEPSAERLYILNDHHEREAEQLIDFFSQLHQRQLLLDRKDGTATPMQWGDIMLLSRKRKPFAAFERVFHNRGIPLRVREAKASQSPYIWRTMRAMLQSLLNPHNDVALLTVLCSPLFDIAEVGLLALVAPDSNNRAYSLWQRIENCIGQPHAVSDTESIAMRRRLERALAAIKRYIRLSGQIPTHDLVNTIYSELGVYQCFCHGLGPHQANLVRNHLDNFLYSMLDIQTGRYTSLHSITEELEAIVEMDGEISEPIALGSANAVRMMTIHQSKGLESPIVALIDAHTGERGLSDFAVLRDVDEQLNITGLTLYRGSLKEAPLYADLIKKEDKENHKDRLNQFYVSLTRAAQLLVISASGNKPNQSDSKKWSWYEHILKNHKIDPSRFRHTGNDFRFAVDSQDNENLGADTDPSAQAEVATATRAKEADNDLPSLDQDAAGMASPLPANELPAKEADGLETDELPSNRQAPGNNTDTTRQQDLASPSPAQDRSVEDIARFKDDSNLAQPGQPYGRPRWLNQAREGFSLPQARRIIGQSQSHQSRFDGTLVHRVLALWAPQSRTPVADKLDGYDDIEQQIKRRIRLERNIDSLGVCPSETELNRAIERARQLMQHNKLLWIFQPKEYRRAWNELSLVHHDGQNATQMYIDRLVDTGQSLWIIDYKSRLLLDGPGAMAQMQTYHLQLTKYCRALFSLNRKLFNDCTTIHSAFLSVSQQRLIPYSRYSLDRLSAGADGRIASPSPASTSGIDPSPSSGH